MEQKNEEVEIDLRELFGVIMSKLGYIVLAGLILALITLVGTKLLVKPQYQSTTKMYVLNKQDNATVTGADLQSSTLLTKDYAEMITSRTVTESVIAKLALDMDHNQLVKKLDVATPVDTRIVSISVKDTDPYVASQIANAVRDAAAEHIQKVMNSEAVNVVEEANIPAKPVSPNVRKNMMIGGLLGIFMAIGTVLAVYMLNDTIKDTEDVDRYLHMSTLGVIPLSEVEKKDKDGKKKKTVRKRKQ